jgi:hypothetical protein
MFYTIKYNLLVMPDQTTIPQQPTNIDPTFVPTPQVTNASNLTEPVTDFAAQGVNPDFSYFDPSAVAQPDGTAPVADYANTAYPEPAPYTPTQDINLNNDQLDPYANIAPAAPLEAIPAVAENTFIEQKTGNKNLLYIAIGAVALLLITVGVFVYLNFTSPKTQETANNNQPSTSDNANQAPKQDEKPAIIDNTLTGGDKTPATLARKNTDKPNAEWFKKWFRAPAIDSEGKCIILDTCGLESDTDKDGLSALQEYQFNTDPQNNDTDQDSIADGDEVNIYYSDPTSKDSDGDTFRDGDEIVGCFDPIVNNATDNISAARITTIGNNVALKTLHLPTSKLLKDKGATQADLNGKGTVSVKCVKPASDSQSNTSTSQNSSSTTLTLQSDEKNTSTGPLGKPASN